MSPVAQVKAAAALRAIATLALLLMPGLFLAWLTYQSAVILCGFYPGQT